LECFEITYCGLNKTNLFNVIPTLSKLHNITDLNFSGNTFTVKNFKIFQLIADNNPHLQQIEMVSCKLRNDEVKKFAEVLRSCNCTNLLHLDISYNTVGGEATDALISVIGNHTKLSYQNLCNCSMSETDFSSFYKLHAITTLTYLDLSNNHITDKYAENVANFIANNASLQHLNLSCCGLESKGILKIIEGLSSITTLLYFTLGSNKLTDQSESVAFKMATSITSNDYMQHLNLSNCNLQSTEINVLIKEMQNLTSLQLIDLGMNDARNGALVEFGPVLVSNKGLQFLHLPVFEYSKETLAKIFDT